MSDLPQGIDVAARALVELLRGEVAKRPQLGAAARILGKALPGAAEQVREVLDNPGPALLGALAHHTRAAREELEDSDRAIAQGLAKAFGRGVARGVKKRGG